MFKLDVLQKPTSIPGMEEKVIDFWEETKAFEKSIENRPEDRSYHFYDGPPFATGLPHYGHIVASLIKDVVPRFWAMKGYRVERKWGWDCHGLPIENIIEKELQLKTKQDIENYGVDRFNEACRATVLRYAEEWKKTVRRMGRWVDMEHDYKTMDLSFMESVWWVFKKLWDKDLVYKGHKAMHVCPRCATPLSNFEVTLGYKEVTDSAVTVKFPVKNAQEVFGIKEDVAVLAWTTTPWTLPGNLLLAVNPKHTYVLVKLDDDATVYVVAESAIERVFGDCSSYRVIKTYSGKDLAGMNLTYEPTFPYVEKTEHAFRIVAADFVTLEEGTGVVHIAPGFGEDDYELGKREGLPVIQHVTMDGVFTHEVTDFAGQPVKPADNPSKTDTRLISWLSAHGKIFKEEKVKHSYPHCWRCDTPLLNYATSSWFVKVTQIKDELLKNNQKIRWVPGHMKEGRFGQWLEGARDWAVSRNRYWGTPLPIWESEDGEALCIGSVRELEELSGKKITDLHKHKIDGIIIKKDGKTYRRIPEVLDCWFESGSMPYGQMHYPFENKALFERSFPAQFIAEGQDQTRGWFYTLHVLATALTLGKNPAIGSGTSMPAFYNVIVNGIVLAQDGKKMSKRLKNYPDPEEIIRKYGADAMRYYLISSPVMEGESLNFSELGVREVYNKVVNTLWNVLVFYEMYADKAVKEGGSDHVLDRWILSRMDYLVRSVTDNMEKYRLVHAARPIAEFISDLSQWYIRRSRGRIKEGEGRIHTSGTLKEVLLMMAKVIAPFMPFMAETIYQSIAGTGSSVHLLDWPQVQEMHSDSSLEQQMHTVRQIVEKIHSKRKEAKIPVRQPLSNCRVMNCKEQLTNELIRLIQDETNIKEIVCVGGEGEKEVELDTTLTPELRAEGKIREIVRSVQILRKEKGCTMDTHIVLTLPKGEKLSKDMLSVIQKETLADKIIWGKSLDISIST